MLTIEEISKLADEYAEKHPKEIIALALESTQNLTISFSGAEDVVLIDLAVKLKKDIQVFTLDTGRLHPETYAFIDKVREHYGLTIDVMSPDAAKLEAYVKAKGLYDFYKSDHHECCGIRKVEPLKRRLANLDGWITGQRKDQSPDTRTDVAVIEQDSSFSTPDKPLLKFNPLANWSSSQVWEYIRMFDVPYNSLHDRGYSSIGCEPCTKAINPGQHEREGRWWWEEQTAKECGLHQGNIIAKG
ncbi:phosphoadenylyl-sulfate reductase [Haliea sp. AH-315-K21]|uniref:Adenosine 5'-phosphosulfate reductase n=1 Tax=SAR86 cluster bacterium TaxID=2030880 RepID=A0A2A5CEX5_9GAMM|nr:phosphoadenylyl-sulfate reductase [Haliea sp. AH-315-K21]PCJ42068.1 MAG: phosphoadenylyl-sulfate reductase [SAR86 cluster bacterium]